VWIEAVESGPAEAGEPLTRRPANEDVGPVGDGAQVEALQIPVFPAEDRRRCVRLEPGEVLAERARGHRVAIDSGVDAAPGRAKAQ